MMSQHDQSREALPLVSNASNDPFDNLGLVRNQDGTFTRVAQFPTTPATPNPDTLSPVLTKDVTLNPTNNTWLRIFIPHKALHNSSNPKKLPLIVYYHGGGFIFFSASTIMNHNFCFNLADTLSTIVAFIEYRLAPEARLPAAYDDAMEALHWLRTTEEKWVREYADFSNCFLMVSSAGGNVAYHVGLRVSATVDELDPLMIKGLILHHPFFGGTKRTDSEMRMENDPLIPLRTCDMMWELALPKGADMDHKYCNPKVVGEGDDICFDEIKRLRWKILVFGCCGDPLIDCQVEFVEMLRSKGVEVVEHLGEGCHGLELVDPRKERPLFVRLNDFIY